MIKNERQYRITNAQAEKFAAALLRFDEHTLAGEVHPLIAQAERSALQSQYDDLRAELSEYEELRSGGTSVIEANSWDDLPTALIKARIAIGMSQRELADSLGMKEQQIQRYEATNYAGASLERVREIIDALGITIREDLFLPSAGANMATLLSRLTKLGLDREFIIQRLLPREAAAALEKGATEATGTGPLALKSAALIGRVYNFTPASIFLSNEVKIASDALGLARFKTGVRTNERKLSAYTVYAHFLALLAVAATQHLPTCEIPTDPMRVHSDIVGTYGAITIESVIRYIWSLGVVVLPLNDSGAFHGACWRVEGRNVIVIKQKTRSNARWIVDALHELRHAGEEPGAESLSFIEGEELSGRRTSKQEEDAIRFSGDVALGGRAEELVALSVKAANGSVEQLKSAVPRVAKREGVAVDALANYMAYRLSLQGQNWWGVANTLQAPDADPWTVARDIFLEHAVFGGLNAGDAELLRCALSGNEM